MAAAVDYFKDEKGDDPELETTLKFLEDYRLKDAEVVRIENAAGRSLPEVNVIAVGESVGHINHAAKAYISEVKKIGSESSSYASIVGTKDDDYLLIDMWSLAVHLVTEESKEVHDVKGMLTELPTAEEEREHSKAIKQEMNVKRPKRRSRKWEKIIASAPD